jgi:nucleoid DNA-binding protein
MEKREKNFGRNEIANAIVAATHISNVKATQCLDTVCTSIANALSRGQGVQLRGFGTWRVKQVKARKGRNMQTGEKVDVPPTRVVRFRLSPKVKV